MRSLPALPVLLAVAALALAAPGALAHGGGLHGPEVPDLAWCQAVECGPLGPVNHVLITCGGRELAERAAAEAAGGNVPSVGAGDVLALAC